MKIKDSRTLLPSDQTIPFSPILALVFDLYGALILQQLHYWLTDEGCRKREGVSWVAKPIRIWVNEFQVFSANTIIRRLDQLEAEGIIISDKLGNMRDQTKWYRIDYEKLHQKITSFALREQPHLLSRSKCLIEEDSLIKTGMAAPYPPGKQEKEDMKTPSSSSAILQNLKESKGTVQPKKPNTTSSIKALWRTVPRYNESVKFMPSPTRIDEGLMSLISKRLGPTADKIFLGVISHWIGYTKFVAKQRALKKTPDAPDLGFILKYVGDAASFHSLHGEDELNQPVTNPVQLIALAPAKPVILAPPTKNNSPVPLVPVPQTSADPVPSAHPEKSDTASMEDIMKWAPVKKE